MLVDGSFAGAAGEHHADQTGRYDESAFPSHRLHDARRPAPVPVSDSEARFA